MDVTSYLLGKKASGGGGKINNQNKDITITENGSTSVSADAGYTGLGTVGIITNVTPDLESKSVTINSNTTTVITPSIDKDGLSQVSVTTNVEAQPDLETKSVTITENGTTTITPTTGKDGMSEVEVTTNVSGGEDLSEYFTGIVMRGDSSSAGFIKTIKKIPDNTVIGDTSMAYAFNNMEKLENLPYNLDTSEVTNMNQAFNGCKSLKTLPPYNVSNVTSFYYMCSSCIELRNVPTLNFSKATSGISLSGTFSNCPKLTDESIDNILISCITAVNFSGTKTLKYLGFDSSSFPASRIEALPHYQNFLDAGWTIGY